MIACRTELTLCPDELKSTHLHVAERGSIVVGLAQVKVADTDAELLKLFVEPALLRSGVGGLLFEWATARAQSLGAVRMIIEADPGAVAFYERMGARYAGFAPSQSIPGRVLPRMLMELDKPASIRSRVSDATKTPITTSAKPMMWNSCGRSPRKTMAIADPNTGTT